ncbi:hypothetical protein QCA50_013264 [Cerrena zonata]|uniref:Uncharacterized protein n=1 Tax=Cerrena zonata TaxID=2478898 RepID=A0AAW0G0J7_9APHY
MYPSSSLNLHSSSFSSCLPRYTLHIQYIELLTLNPDDNRSIGFVRGSSGLYGIISIPIRLFSDVVLLGSLYVCYTRCSRALFLLVISLPTFILPVPSFLVLTDTSLPIPNALRLTVDISLLGIDSLSILVTQFETYSPSITYTNARLASCFLVLIHLVLLTTLYSGLEGGRVPPPSIKTISVTIHPENLL